MPGTKRRVTKRLGYETSGTCPNIVVAQSWQTWQETASHCWTVKHNTLTAYIDVCVEQDKDTAAGTSSNSTGTSFPVTSSRTCWRRRQLPRNKLATSYGEVSDTPDHLDMLRWSESRQLPRNFLVTIWRLPRDICYGEVTGKLVPVEFELIWATLNIKWTHNAVLNTAVNESSAGR